MSPAEFPYVMFQALNNRCLDSKARPGYRFSLPNLPGIRLVISRRDDTLVWGATPSWDPWGVFDEDRGLHIGVSARTTNSCYESAVKELKRDTPESYAMRLNDLHCRRITTILTEGMK